MSEIGIRSPQSSVAYSNVPAKLAQIPAINRGSLVREISVGLQTASLAGLRKFSNYVNTSHFVRASGVGQERTFTSVNVTS